MALQVKINNKTVGEGNRLYVIAEAGSNHNGSLETAQKLIDAAVAAKTDAVKFQLFKADKIYPKQAAVATYLADQYKNIHELIRTMEMPEEWLPKLAAYCKEKGIDFICSPFDEGSVDALEVVGVPAYKVASSECNHIPLIEHIAKKMKPIILSTGISSLGEIEDAVNAIRKYHDQIIIMHTIVTYPAEIAGTNLRYINYLENIFQAPAGLSDHSMDPVILPVATAAIGGRIIEKHFTLDKTMPGPDHKFALNPEELKAMVAAIRSTEAGLAPRNNKMLDTEAELVAVSKRALQAARDLKTGETLRAEDIAILRPGAGVQKGIAPKFLHDIIGKKVQCDVTQGSGITWDTLLAS